MSRGRNRSASEWRRYKKFEEENQRLRKEVSKLRKVINNMVIDHLEERVRKVDDGDEPISHVCEVCGNDDLHIVPINRVDGNFEIRVCKSCNYKSQMKKVKS